MIETFRMVHMVHSTYYDWYGFSLTPRASIFALTTNYDVSQSNLQSMSHKVQSNAC